jgi:hypothetical protein
MEVFKKIPEGLDTFTGDLVVAVVGEDERPLQSTNAWLDWRLFGSLTDLLVKELFTGKLGEKCLVPTYGKFQFDRLVLIGGGSLFEEALYPTDEAGKTRWNAIADLIEQTARSLKVEQFGLSLPRFELVDHERALLKALQLSKLPSDTTLFMARAATYTQSTQVAS